LGEPHWSEQITVAEAKGVFNKTSGSQDAVTKERDAIITARSVAPEDTAPPNREKEN